MQMHSGGITSASTRILASKNHKTRQVIDALAAAGIRSSVVGELIPPDEGMILMENGIEKKLEHFVVDAFWEAFYTALENKNARG